MPELVPYLADILDQPRTLATFARRARLERVRALARRQPVILTGMGASLAALRPAWMTLIAAGIPAWLIETAELVNDVPGLMDGDVLVLAASQSGHSAESVALVDEALQPANTLVAITNDPDSPLAAGADATVEIHAGEEHAVSTRSYVNTLAAAQLVADMLAGDASRRDYEAVAASLDRYLESWADRVAHLTALVGLPPRLYLLARGASLAAASCGALIAKEAAKQPVEGMSVPQFRHGPLELADERLTAIVLAGTGADRERNRRLYEDLERFGATALWFRHLDKVTTVE